jgi:hypothetical protein
MVRPRSPLALFGIASAVAMCAAGLALANTTTVNDSQDTKGPIDIKSASAGHAKHGKLKHVIVFYADVPPSGETGNELLYMWKKKPHPLPGVPGAFKEDAYKVQMPQDGKRPVFTGGGAEDVPTHKTGTAKVTRKGDKLTIVFSKKAIGSPEKAYWWHVRSDYYGPDSECGMAPCEDNAPDGSKAVKHKL